MVPMLVRCMVLAYVYPRMVPIMVPWMAPMLVSCIVPILVACLIPSYVRPLYVYCSYVRYPYGSYFFPLMVPMMVSFLVFVLVPGMFPFFLYGLNVGSCMFFIFFMLCLLFFKWTLCRIIWFLIRKDQMFIPCMFLQLVFWKVLTLVLRLVLLWGPIMPHYAMD